MPLGGRRRQRQPLRGDDLRALDRPDSAAGGFGNERASTEAASVRSEGIAHELPPLARKPIMPHERAGQAFGKWFEGRFGTSTIPPKERAILVRRNRRVLCRRHRLPRETMRVWATTLKNVVRASEHILRKCRQSRVRRDQMASRDHLISASRAPACKAPRREAIFHLSPFGGVSGVTAPPSIKILINTLNQNACPSSPSPQAA